MLSAKEACKIANDAKRHEDELKTIMQYIIEAAQEGKNYVNLYPSINYSIETLNILEDLGYGIIVYNDILYNYIANDKKQYYITWR